MNRSTSWIAIRCIAAVGGMAGGIAGARWYFHRDDAPRPLLRDAKFLPDSKALKLAEAIGAPWESYDDKAFVDMTFGIADLADAIAYAGESPTSSGAKELSEAINKLERAHGKDPLVIPHINLGRAALKQAGFN